MTTAMPSSPEGFARRLRGYFITGLLVLVPIILTVIIIYRLFLLIDGILRGVVTTLLRAQVGWDLHESQIPGLGFVTLVILIFLTGVLARQYFGKKLIESAERLVNRIPLVKGVYNAVRQISAAFFTENRQVFNRVVLIRFPHKSSYAIGFTVQERNPLMRDVLPGDLVSVFLPSTPNPTTGFLLFVPREEVINLDVSVEDALKMVISGGTIPPSKAVLAQGEHVDILQTAPARLS